jgi:glycosyltransferase involved in cell wall biosynthesis
VIDQSWLKCSYLLKTEGVLKIPILGVCHAPIETMFQSPPPVPLPCLVGISKDMVDNISAHLGVPARLAYNGLDLDFYKNSGEARTDRYLFLARMSKIKGPHIAVDLARKFRFPLDLVGDDKITGDPEYAQRLYDQARSTLNIKYHGGISREETIKFFSRAKVMLHMNKAFREPFGMAPVEAQLCGLPVISYDNGAMRETIKHGETGFVCKTDLDVEQVIKGDLCSGIKPETCREWASQFSLKNMTDGYEKLMQEAKDTGGW